MRFHPKPLFVLAAFVVLLVMALNPGAWGTAAILAAIVIEVLLYAGIFGSSRGRVGPRGSDGSGLTR